MGCAFGTHTFVVGVEDNGDGALRVYLGHRAKGLYVLVEDEDAKAQVQRAWEGCSGHITIAVPPPECIFKDARP